MDKAVGGKQTSKIGSCCSNPDQEKKMVVQSRVEASDRGGEKSDGWNFYFESRTDVRERLAKLDPS